MAEYGVFNDEGCIDAGYITLEQAEEVAVGFRRQGDEYARAAEICPDHAEEPREGCEECDTDGAEDEDDDADDGEDEES